MRIQLAVFLGALAIAGCGKKDTLTINPSTPAAAGLTPAPMLEKYSYKKILLLPYEGEIEISKVDPTVTIVNDKNAGYFTAKLEKALLASGFEVISPEVVAKVAKESKQSGKMSSAEKALLLGRKTKADAVFMIQSLAIVGSESFYHVDKLKTRKLDRAKVDQNLKNGEYFEKETKDCVIRVPYYEIRLEGKLIESRDGNVLWVGDAVQTNIDSFKRSWVAELDKKCGVEQENFVYKDDLASEDTLTVTFTDLVARLVPPLKKPALKGDPIVEKKKEPPKPPPKVEPKPEPPKKKTAVVSTRRASLRAGPGRRNSRLRYFTRKTKVEVVETVGEWTKVKGPDGSVGWMHESTIIMNEN